MGFRNQLYNQSPMLEEGDGGCERCVSSWCSQQSATHLEVAWRRQLPGFRWAKGRDLTCFFLNNLVQKSWHMMMRKFISQMDPNGQFIIWWIHCFFLGGAHLKQIPVGLKHYGRSCVCVPLTTIPKPEVGSIRVPGAQNVPSKVTVNSLIAG